MEPFAKETLPISLEEEMRRSYLDYAMSVIVGRALPDVRDGLKPVHRRVLYAMHEANNTWNRPYVKCARIVGEVLGKYHPHGDTATYEALVRMAQDFSMRYTLVDGQGNFGSVDGDAAAAYRYTECRLDKIASEMLLDIDKETVDFTPNYDGKEREPAVLPTRVPNLLVNGSSGIAVGMATNIPPHNLGEVVDACLHVLAQPHCAIEEVIKLMPAPDFPTAGIIYGLGGVHEGYRTGRGRVVIRARTHFEETGRGDRQAVAPAGLLEVRARADHHAAATRAVALVHAAQAVDDAGGREIGRRHQLDHFLDGAVRLGEHMQAGIDHFAEVVRRDVGRHAHGDARGAVDQQVGNARRQDGGLALLAIVVRREIDRLLVDVEQHLGGDLVQPAFGIAIGRCRVAVHRAEIALAVDQRVAHGEILRHAHQRLVGRGVAVRVVLAQHFADNARAFHVRPVPGVVRLVHRVQHPAVDRLQAVAHVGERAAHDHAHGVIEIRAPHLLFEADRQGFFGERFHFSVDRHGRLGGRKSASGKNEILSCEASDFPRTNVGPAGKNVGPAGAIVLCRTAPLCLNSAVVNT